MHFTVSSLKNVIFLINEKTFHYVNEIFKEINSLYFCLIRILKKKKNQI